MEGAVRTLQTAAQTRKSQIEDQIRKLRDIDEKLDRFMEDLTRSRAEFDRQSSLPKLDPRSKRDLVDSFEKANEGLEKVLAQINGEVDSILSDVEDTPFLKRRLQEARHKLDDFTLELVLSWFNNQYVALLAIFSSSQ